MDTNTSFLVFGIENAFYLLDNYITKDIGYITSGIRFPSVRHIVLASKTKDFDLKQQIAQAELPANLKQLELSLTNPPEYWNIDFILKKMYYWTLYKFKISERLKEGLKSTRELELVDDLKNHFEIEELREIPNYRGEILMRIRKEIFS